MYNNNKNMHNEESTEFNTKVRLKECCVLSPLLFSIVLEAIIRVCKTKSKGITICNWQMKTKSPGKRNRIRPAEKPRNILRTHKRNIDKNKTMIISMKERKHRISMYGQVGTKQVSSYSSLGTIIEKYGKIDKEINERIGKVERLYKSLRNTFLDKKVSKEIKTQINKKVMRPRILYGNESYTLTIDKKQHSCC